MPQVFSMGWLYLFVIIMAICVLWIFVKLRVIQREPDMHTPVLHVAPVRKDLSPPGGEEDEEKEKVLEEPDRLIREGSYKEAATALTSLLEDLSRAEDRALMGKIQYRLGAIWRLIGVREGQAAHLLRSGVSLREAVSFFSPPRLRPLQAVALAELAGLYEDLARHQSPAENLALSIRTWDFAAAASRTSGMAPREAVCLSRSGTVHRNLAVISDRLGNLSKAVKDFETAISIPGAFDGESALFEKAKILKMLGDTRLALSMLLDREDNLRKAVSDYDEALEIMTTADRSGERCATLLDAGRALLDLFDLDRNPVDLRKAFRILRQALDLVKEEPAAAGKGIATALMGDAFLRYSEVKDGPENLERAVRLYETALGFFKEPEYASHRDRVKEELKKAVEKKSSVEGGK